LGMGVPVLFHLSGKRGGGSLEPKDNKCTHKLSVRVMLLGNSRAKVHARRSCGREMWLACTNRQSDPHTDHDDHQPGHDALSFAFRAFRICLIAFTALFKILASSADARTASSSIGVS